MIIKKNKKVIVILTFINFLLIVSDSYIFNIFWVYIEFLIKLQKYK